ncbi:hypothetical protein SapgrDRAFT_3255 [Saprospira grandis DSM 2844]|uniref:DUF4279 domain-containing protein n=1 Tax=Saprospira grandis DSM 2844 TaxID=694433 RepID=J1I7V3_9BACT|nr:DUF4279 domain-containing protein [Saprospira grandis]EJF54900.1 hypothetical protein SapgrDRAFT_3255 [Saprospira grandis DSM 2844]
METNVRARFVLFSEGKIEQDKISQQLDLLPTREGVNMKVEPAEAFWELAIDTKITFYTEEVTNELLTLLEGKETVLLKLKNEFALKSKLYIVPVAENKILPSIDINKRLLRFLYLTDTALDIDLYVNW